VLEGLENRLLFSAAQAVPPPPANTPETSDDAAEYVMITHGDDKGESYDASHDHWVPSSAPTTIALMASDTHDSQVAVDSSGSVIMCAQPQNADHTTHDWHGTEDDILVAMGQPRDTEYMHVQGLGGAVTVYPAYVFVTGTVAGAVAVRPLDRSGASPTAAVAPKPSAATSTTGAVTSRNSVAVDSNSIATSAPQHASVAPTQTFAIAPIGTPMTASTPHTHVENSLLIETWRLGVASFSQAPIVTGLDWEVAAATDSVSAGASINFVENLITSDAAALARVANTVALRLYEENAMLWKEAAAFIGAAMLVGGYLTRHRPAAQAPPRRRALRAAHRCIGEPE
jgi:hypothetical protein